MAGAGTAADPLVNDASERLVVAITARALFDLEATHAVFEGEGLEAYASHQRAREDEILEPGIAFPLVRKLLALNEGTPADAPRVEVVLLSRNSSDTGLRIFNSIEHHKLAIARAVFTSGEPTTPYIQPFGAQLFLSANPASVRRALADGVAAATILPAKAAAQVHDQLRIAFDGDAVIFGDESERVSHLDGLAALHRLQSAVPAERSPIRTALVTARSAPAHKRVILTLREWGVRLDEALFLGGRDKGPFLATFGADIFFDDSRHNISNASRHVASGHVPHGIANLE
jgi:5'-nucleotidase